MWRRSEFELLTRRRASHSVLPGDRSRSPPRRRAVKTSAAFLAVLITIVAVGFASAQPLPVVKPEQVGLSSQRLDRVAQTLKMQIGSGRFPGAVFVIARKGKIAYFESVGQGIRWQARRCRRTRSSASTR